LEDELENAKDPRKFVTGLDSEALDAILAGKIDKFIPTKMRRLLKTCLIGDERFRYARYINLVKEVDAASRSTTYQVFQSKAKPYAIGAAAVALLGGMIGLGFTVGNYESKEHSAPAISRIISTPTMTPILVQSEELTDLPPMASGGVFSAPNFVENHREHLPQHLAIFTGTYGAAINGGIENTTPYQHALLSRKVHPAITKGFDYHLGQQRSTIGMIPSANVIALTYDKYLRHPTFDLEDFCVEARYGPATLALAKKFGGENFNDYIHAKTPDGARIFNDDDERMLKTWLYSLR
jgi:hypothetical protein